MKKVIFYLVDGARPDILTKLLEEGKLPNMAAMIQSGSYSLGTTTFPSTTGPAYLPILTGSSPADHDITGIRWFDKPTYFEKGRWSRDTMRSYCGYEAKYFNADMNPEFPSLFELHKDGINIYNMITKGVLPENDVTAKGKTKLYFRAHFYHEHHAVDLAGHQLLLKSLDNNPSFVFAVFPSVDWDSHTYHYDDARTHEAYSIADKSLGEMIEGLKFRQQYQDTLILVASDHGLTATHTHLDLGKFFKKNGYRVLEYPTIHALLPEVAVFISGNSFATISFLDHKEMYREDGLWTKHGEVLQTLLIEPAVDLMIYRKTNNSFVVRNKKGSAIVTQSSADTMTYRIESDDVLGLGNDVVGITTMEALQRSRDTNYPDSLYQISKLMRSDRSGDVVISATVGYDFRDFWEIPEHKGSHGSLHRDHMVVPIISNQSGLMDKFVRTETLYSVINNWLK